MVYIKNKVVALDLTADKFTTYIITLFYPWSLETGAPLIPLTWNALSTWISELAISENYIHRHILFWIRNISQGLVVNSRAKKLSSMWRMGCAKVWTESEQQNAGV